jgi:lipid-binding SYLF domain-containing protein
MEENMTTGFATIVPSLSLGLFLLTCAPNLYARSDSKEADRLQNSALVIKEAMGMKSQIPQKLLDKAYCVIVIPSALKGAVGFGGSYGRGAMSCRGGNNFKGPWTAPTMMALEGASAGLQLGGQATDFVLLVMDDRGARSILSGKFKIGGDAAAAAGPVGRDAQANLDVYLRTTILSYSRSRGLFAGVSLEGSTLRPDKKANEKLYGKDVSARSIVLENAVATPASAEPLIAELNRYGESPTAKSASAGSAPPQPQPPPEPPAQPPAPAPNRPPTVTCSGSPLQVVSGSGNTVLVHADASDPDNDPLTYAWTATGGTVDGSGAEVRWNPAGVAPGTYSITARVDDGRGGTADCRAELTVEAPPPPVEKKLAIHSVFFPTALPTREKPNRGLVESQQETLRSLASNFKEYLESHPDAHLLLQGHADHRGRPKFNEALSERRADLTKRFLVGLGVPEANLETKAFGEEADMTKEQVKQLVEEHPHLSQEQKNKILNNLSIVTQAQNRRVDITLSGTGQQSVRQFPFNAEDALTLLSPKKAGPNLSSENKP